MSSDPKRIPIDEATRDELAAFAALVLQLDVRKNETASSLIRKIKNAGHAEDYILSVEDADLPTIEQHREAAREERVRRTLGEVRSASSSVKTPGDGAPKVRIRVHAPDSGLASARVPVSVNGFRMDIPTGEAVEVPWPYFEALQNAIKTEYSLVEDENGRLRLEPRDVPAYSFSVLSMPSRNEVEEWKRSSSSES